MRSIWIFKKIYLTAQSEQQAWSNRLAPGNSVRSERRIAGEGGLARLLFLVPVDVRNTGAGTARNRLAEPKLDRHLDWPGDAHDVSAAMWSGQSTDGWPYDVRLETTVNECFRIGGHPDPCGDR